MGLPDSILGAMRETNNRFAKIVATQDFDGLDQVYTQHARILPPGADMVTGREAIKAFWKQAVNAMGVKSAKLWTVEGEMVGNHVVEIGGAELTLNDGQVVPVKYVVYWKQEGGFWKWNYDIWNS